MRISDWSSDVCSSDLLGMISRHAVRQRQAARIEDPRLRAQTLQEPGCLLGQKAAVGSLSKRAVQQQNARRVRRYALRGELAEIGDIQERLIQSGKGLAPEDVHIQHALALRTSYFPGIARTHGGTAPWGGLDDSRHARKSRGLGKREW